ncbi:predicted protein [Chaetoceros tenuissimus]|uniref:Uncharacterized protein n=1 Tax=Chaetoceros tenuissimus TaxID=426638 RepID=A0AAD3CZV8_9STRA|nr:predicted protein [Chaetoceros tenuissimus]
MNFNSPSTRKCSFSIGSTSTKTPSNTTNDNNAEDNVNATGVRVASSSDAFSSDLNLQHKMQSQISVTELDRLQRKKREERERLYSNLQSLSFVQGLMANDIQSFPSMGDLENDENDVSLGWDIDDGDRAPIDEEVSWLNRGLRLAPSDSRSETGPVPRLRIRPNSHVFQKKEEPVIILPRDEDAVGEMVNLIPSPHSNKFVLQFPDAPTQELMLNTSIEERHEMDTDFEEEEAHEELDAYKVHSSLDASGMAEAARSYLLKPIRSDASLHATGDESDSSSSSTCPSPLKRRISRKKKINLQPKKRRSNSTAEMIGDLSPGSTSSSCLDENETHEEVEHELPNPQDFRQTYQTPNTSKNCNSILLKSRRCRKLSLTKAPYDDEHGDSVMELDPELKSSKKDSFDIDDLSCGAYLTRHHSRCLSVSFADDDTVTRQRSPSTCSIQDQIEMAKEAAARFGKKCTSQGNVTPSRLSHSLSESVGDMPSNLKSIGNYPSIPQLGMTRHSSVGSTTVDIPFTSPSNLSESNFRTPNPDSIDENVWLDSSKESDCRSLEKLSSSSTERKGLFIPKLFGDPGEDGEMLI